MIVKMNISKSHVHILNSDDSIRKYILKSGAFRRELQVNGSSTGIVSGDFYYYIVFLVDHLPKIKATLGITGVAEVDDVSMYNSYFPRENPMQHSFEFPPGDLQSFEFVLYNGELMEKKWVEAETVISRYNTALNNPSLTDEEKRDVVEKLVSKESLLDTIKGRVSWIAEKRNQERGKEGDVPGGDFNYWEGRLDEAQAIMNICLLYLAGEDDAGLDYVSEALEILVDMIDEDDCRLDHNGGCQTHCWFSDEAECPHKRAKVLLKKLYEE